MCQVICPPEAAIPIKSYSPELMVLPLLPSAEEIGQNGLHSEDLSKKMTSLNKWVSSCHALVIGCGLGREPNLHPVLVSILYEALGKVWVWDADMLWFLTECDKDGKIAELLKKNAEKTVLTPNFIETSRLCKKFGLEMVKPSEKLERKPQATFEEVLDFEKAQKEIAELCKKLGNPIIIGKNKKWLPNGLP